MFIKYSGIKFTTSIFEYTHCYSERFFNRHKSLNNDKINNRVLMSNNQI